jgi:hypothetical protein
MTLMVTNLIGFGARASTSHPTFLSIIQDASLTTNLQLVLDAGDVASYPSGSKWLDVSGNGYDFEFGSTSGPDSDDPTFNGAAGGLSENEYFTSDGGDRFTYDSSNETWMNSLHKNGAVFSFMAVFYNNNGVINAGSTFVSTNSEIGVQNNINTSRHNFGVAKGTPGAPLDARGDTLLTNPGWNFCGVSLDENGGDKSFFYLNGAYNQEIAVGSTANTFDAAYSSPSSSAATDVFHIFADKDNGAASGARMAILAWWSGTALTKANYDTVWAEIRGRYSL